MSIASEQRSTDSFGEIKSPADPSALRHLPQIRNQGSSLLLQLILRIWGREGALRGRFLEAKAQEGIALTKVDDGA